MKKNSIRMCVIFVTIFILGGVLWSTVQAGEIDFSRIRVRISLHETSIPIKLNGDYFLQQNHNLVLKEGSYTLSVVDKDHVRIRGGEIDEKFKTTLTIVPMGEDHTVRLKGDEHGTRNYLGQMEFRAVSEKLRAINHIDLERYLYGVVPYEMHNSWPVDALKAQAVTARGYAAIRISQRQNNTSTYYDVVDTVAHQVYRGFDPQFSRAIQAVDETKGEVLTYNGRMIDTYYAASNGGFTELIGNTWGGGDAKNKEFPYLIFKEDPYDLENPASLYQRFFVPKVVTEFHGLVDGQEVARVTATVSLNVRTGPGTSYDRIGQVQNGDLLPYLETVNGWYKVVYEGMEAYISGDYADIETAKLDDRYQYFSPVLNEMQELAYNKLVSDGKKIESRHDVRLTEIRKFENGTKRWPGTVTESYVTANATVRVRFHENGSSSLSSAQNVNITMEIMRKNSNGNYVMAHPYLDSRLRLRRVIDADEGYILTNGRFGHGIGMSQRGAEQMTKVHGKDYKYVLAFYYVDTKISKIDTKASEYPRVTSNKFTVSNDGITKVDTGLSVKAFRDHLTATGGTLKIIGSDGKEKTSGIIATGDQVEVTSSENGNIKSVYPVIIYGDVSGNGEIALRDLLLVQRHILGISSLDGPYAKAADVEKAGSIRLRDLLMIQRHILGIQKITQ